MMMEIQCDVCGTRCWTRGYVESDTNAVILDENHEVEGECAHMKEGGAVTVVDEEYDEDDA